MFNTGSKRATFAIAILTGKRLRSFGGVDAGPAYWSPRGNQIVYVEGGFIGRRDQLFAVRSDGRGVKQITHDRPVAYDDPIGHVVWVGRAAT